MGRKVFISFLGTSKYTNCNYYPEGNIEKRINDVKYVQEALLQLYCTDFDKEDTAFFFLTKDAKKQNWVSDGHWNRETNKYDLENIGLYQRLQDMKAAGQYKGQLKAVDIPEGFSSEEIWSIFQVVFDCLEPEDAIILDITHAFRSLPMLGMVLINYAKTLKSATIKGIYYGAFEQLGIASKVGKMDIDDRNAPILNLSAFAELQEWTVAAREFIQLGKTDSLAVLIKGTQNQLAEELVAFEQSIATCRGKLLTQKMDINGLKNTLAKSMNAPIKEQLKPLLSKIEEKIAPFENANTLKNGFAAVEWCIQHNMIQQGITFLQESLVSHIVEEFAGEEKLNQLFYREIATTALQLFPFQGNRHFSKTFLDETIEYQEAIKTIYTEMRDFVKEKEPLSDLFWDLTGKNGLRNDINHCGFRENDASAQKLTEFLEKLYNNIKILNL